MTLFGFALSWYLVILGLAVTIFLLDRPNLHGIALSGAVLAATLGSYSSLEGLLIWPVGFLLLYHRMRSRWTFMTWGIAAIAVTVVYLWHLNPGGASIDKQYVLDHPLQAARFFFFAIGNVAGVPVSAVPSSRDYAFLVLGCIIFSVAVWVLITGVPRPSQPTGISIGVALVLFGMGYTVGLTVARSGFGLPVLPRYAIFDLVLLAGCYLYLLERLLTAGGARSTLKRREVSPEMEAGPRRVGYHFWILVIVLCVIGIQVSVGTFEALKSGEVWRAKETRIANITVNIARAPDAMVAGQLGSGWEPAGFIRQLTHFARDQRLSLFSTPSFLAYSREGLPGSNVPPVTHIVLPRARAIVRGNELLVATAYANVGVTNVEFEYQAQNTTTSTIIGRAVLKPYGWLAGWNTSAVPDGIYRVRSVATDSLGLVAFSAPVTVAINN